MLIFNRVAMVAVQWTTVVYVVCALAVSLMPGPSVWLGQRAFHMMGNPSLVGNPMLSFTNLLVGLIFWDVIAYLGAGLLVWLWNRSK